MTESGASIASVDSYYIRVYIIVLNYGLLANASESVLYLQTLP